MDASNEFRFISPAIPKKKNKRNRKNSNETENSENCSTADRPVPVCLYNANKNVKLRFVWDKAFKLFTSARPVYKAISGLNQEEKHDLVGTTRSAAGGIGAYAGCSAGSLNAAVALGTAGGLNGGNGLRHSNSLVELGMRKDDRPPFARSHSQHLKNEKKTREEEEDCQCTLCRYEKRKSNYSKAAAVAKQQIDSDSGLDTWKQEEISEDIHCTIGQKSSVNNINCDSENSGDFENGKESGSGKFGSGKSGSGKVGKFELRKRQLSRSDKNSKLNSRNGSFKNDKFEEEKVTGNFENVGNTSVVLLNVSNEDYSSDCFECMSEIDLNSESSSENMKVLLTEVEAPMVIEGVKSFNENEFDSLDLTLFETRERKNARAFFDQLTNLAVFDEQEEFEFDCDESHFYDSLLRPTDTYKSYRIGDEEKSRKMSTLDCRRNEDSASGYFNWSDAGSEFEFMGPNTLTNREISLGQRPRGVGSMDVEWEPYFCVLNQADQTFTSYRSEDMSIFPGTPTRPRTPLFGDGNPGSDIPSVRVDGGPGNVKCLLREGKWAMNPLMEEDEDEGRNNQENSTQKLQQMPCDTSYDKACGSQPRRGSAPLTPLLGRDTPSRFANFFSKRSFKSNPLKRTKSVTKLERKKPSGSETESPRLNETNRLRSSRSHESLLGWGSGGLSPSSFVNHGMMNTVDLAGGDITVRPLHASILDGDFVFQVGTRNGTKYYSCTSAAERDAWVSSLREAIKPYADEVRRSDSSLKIWVLEAKGLGKRGKRFFCQLYLDDALYGRTCPKGRGDLLFWGEHFDFNQLPHCTNTISVLLFREADKKRKKEKHTLIGRVLIPVGTVKGRSLVEKWYPLVLEGKENREGASLRVKAKFLSVDILPLRCYKPFLHHIKEEYGPICEALEGLLSVKAKEELASSLVHVLHHEGIAKELIADLALQEILKSGDEKLTFRGNSIATKAMESFLKVAGAEYLHNTLGPFIEEFQGADEPFDCEVDPLKLTAAADLSRNQRNLRNAVDAVWKSILHSAPNFPIELRELFRHCRESLEVAGRSELADHLLSASLFLRFLCPAILSPSLFNITNEYPSEKAARNLTLMAKVLQTLANFTRFQGKENYMEFINDFLIAQAPSMKAFLSSISSPLNNGEVHGRSRSGAAIDLGKYTALLSTLLSESVGKIISKNERFKELGRLLEEISSWLKQPANATNVALFPFPHAPPPSCHPPPVPSSLPRGECGVYAVSSLLPNGVNPKVSSVPPLLLNMGGRAGSQASSGYHSHSPVLDTEKQEINQLKNQTEQQQSLLQHVNAQVHRKTPDPLSHGQQIAQRIGRSGSSSEADGGSCSSSPLAVSPVKGIGKRSGGQRGNRRSSADLLRRPHPYSSSTDEESERAEEPPLAVPQLPPRRSHLKRKEPLQNPEMNSSNFTINCVQYESEMVELRRAMEALQVKLNRAEERLFGHETRGEEEKNGNGTMEASEKETNVEQLLQRLLCAEEEMKREQELLSALDKKQKLIDAQEQKIARLDAVNVQLLSALAQIRDSLQAQQFAAQQQKVAAALEKQQLHLNVLNGQERKGNSLGNRAEHTTKIFISSESSGASSPSSPPNINNNNNRDSAAFIGEQALRMLADLKSSSC